MEKLRVCNLEMEYEGKKALDNVSFEVMNGEFLSILGPSGCGKTTLLRILTGILKPSGGKILKDGKDITGVSPDQRGMGIVFQNYALFENMTVLENVEYALKIKKENRSKEGKRKVRETALNMLEQLQLTPFLDRRPAALSGGQQQRVAIARTLVMNPDIILFDEPMSALDVAARISLRAEIKRIQKEYGTTMIYITHDQEEAFAMSDRIMVMQEAKVVQLDKPENILAHPGNEYVENFVLKNLKLKMDSLRKYVQ